MTFNTSKLALALASTIGIAYIVCGIIVALAPNLALSLFSFLVHMVNLGQVQITFGGFLAGLIEAVVYMYFVSWLFGTLYNWLIKTSK